MAALENLSAIRADAVNASLKGSARTARRNLALEKRTFGRPSRIGSAESDLPLNDRPRLPMERRVNFEPVLPMAVEQDASDVHLKAGGTADGAHRRRARSRSTELGDVRQRDARGRAERDRRQRAAAASPTFHETGELDTAYQLPGLPRFRVNAFRQRGAISIRVSRHPARRSRRSRASTCPPGVERLAEEHRGLVLVTGATGSGKSTTLAAMLDHINRTRRQHIVTIEDPIEMLHPDAAASSTSARSGSTPSRSAGAAPRAPPGPGRDPDRRAARRRDRRDRAPGGRVRPPRPLDDAHGRRRRDDRAHGRVLPGDQAAGGPLDPRRRAAGRRLPAAAAAHRAAAASPRSR